MAAVVPTAAEKMVSYLSRGYLSRLSPIPSFPEYTGPYKVGTVDVEIPVSELDAPSPAPDTAADLHTVQFRIFYPAQPDSKGKRISWLPAPQRLHVSAYTQFLGIGPMVASVLSFIPRHLHYTSIPVHKNAALLPPSENAENDRWPTMIFSHGLGGNRNAYSHLAGSLASHGVMVICPEHRDGSAAVSFVRDPKAQNRFFIRSTRRVIPYRRIPHTQTPDVWEARDAQLRTRLWELGLVHEAVLAIDSGTLLTNLNASTPKAALDQFMGKMHVHEPGSIIFAGHSFGASTTLQFLKSTYYADTPELAAMPSPLFRPRPGSSIRRQVTDKNPTILLDMWCFPLHSAATAPLYSLPLPVYADVPSAPGGSALLAVESEAFYKWTEHLHATARILSPDPTAPVVRAAAYDRPSSELQRLAEPNFFYVRNSAHLSQSDFGVLFPWLTKKVFGAEEPERALRLNLRAVLQLLRANGVPVARTWVGDLVDGAHVGKMDIAGYSDEEEGSDDASSPPRHGSLGDKGPHDGIRDDRAIFERAASGAVEAWHWIDIVGLGGEAGATEAELESTREGSDETAGMEEDTERQMEGEIEPHLIPDGRDVGTLQAVAAAA